MNGCAPAAIGLGGTHLGCWWALEPGTTYGLVAVVAALGILALALWGRGPTRLLTGRRGRVPRQLELKDIPSDDIPADAREPLAYLTEKLTDLGFEIADLPARVPALQRFGHRLIVVPFVHLAERAYFLMGIEAGIHPSTQLVLHIITPLEGQQRVETSTLVALSSLRAPAKVHAQVVLDAESVEEIWSRHRRALTEHRRDERLEVTPAAWRDAAYQAYEGWVQSAVRAQRLQLEADGQMYRVRGRARSVL